MKQKVKSRIVKTLVHDIYTLYWTDEAILLAEEKGDGIIGFYFDGYGIPSNIYLSSCYGVYIKKTYIRQQR